VGGGHAAAPGLRCSAALPPLYNHSPLTPCTHAPITAAAAAAVAAPRRVPDRALLLGEVERPLAPPPTGHESSLLNRLSRLLNRLPARCSVLRSSHRKVGRKVRNDRWRRNLPSRPFRGVVALGSRRRGGHGHTGPSPQRGRGSMHQLVRRPRCVSHRKASGLPKNKLTDEEAHLQLYREVVAGGGDPENT
jgi:hypothetical protein